MVSYIDNRKINSKNKKSEEILTQLKILETVEDIKSLSRIAKSLIDLANPLKH